MNTRFHGPIQLVLLASAIVLAAGVALASGSPYDLLYQFQGGRDGYYPGAILVADRGGNLYGTTLYGGASGACEGQPVNGCGTVFQLRVPATTGGSWSETVLYRFQGGADGAFPESNLVFDEQGNLYGATTGGGSANCTGGCGTVFKLSPPASPGGAWTEAVLYAFGGVPSGSGNGDAAQPNGLIFGGRSLFGTASSGGHCTTDETGTYCYGAIFKLTPPASSGGTWSENIVYRFAGPTGAPAGPIFDTGGHLYGSAGGGLNGYGMIFKVDRLFSTGDTPLFLPVYNFQGGADGAFPNRGLIFDGSGNLYGTTFGGGAANTGTVFELTPPANAISPWTETQLYAFTTTPGDAGTPDGHLVLDGNGSLYGAAQGGGQFSSGAIFAVSPPSTTGNPWTETVVHSFDFTDGAVPGAGPILGSGGNVYGTTEGGGSAGSGQCVVNGSATSCGVVFQYVP